MSQRYWATVYFFNKRLSWTFTFRHFGAHSFKIRHLLKAKKNNLMLHKQYLLSTIEKKKRKTSYQVFSINGMIYFSTEYKWLKAARLQYKSTCRAYLARPLIKAVHEAKVTKYTKPLLRVQHHAWGFKASKLRREEKKSPYDQFLGATQRRADSHKTADEACEQKTVIVNGFFPLKGTFVCLICEKRLSNSSKTSLLV